MRLAAIVICVGAANSLANPKRLLKSVPPALYEIGTALVVAVTVFPQLADSVRRVRAAQALRGDVSGRVGRLRRLLVPGPRGRPRTSLSLAAGMDARGYGRAGTATRGQRWTTGVLLLGALCGVCVGTYALLDRPPALLAVPMLVIGAVVAVVGLVSAGRRVERTRYRPDRWRLAESWCRLAGWPSASSLAARPDRAARRQPVVTSMPYLSVVALGRRAARPRATPLAAPPPRRPHRRPRWRCGA